MRRALGLVAAALFVTAAGGCTPVSDGHGWAPDSAEALEVQPGVDTKTTVLARMGTPSTKGAFDDKSWYYVSSVQERMAFYTPMTTARAITVVHFGDDDVVASVERFGLEKGQVVAYNDNKTPTRGRELGILEQLFGNIGSTPPIVTEDEGRDQRR